MFSGEISLNLNNKLYKNNTEKYIVIGKNEFFGRFIDCSKYFEKPGEYEIQMKYEGPVTRETIIQGVKVSGKYIYLNSNKLIIQVLDKEKEPKSDK